MGLWMRRAPAAGADRVGGLVGENSETGSVRQCYATGAVNGDENAGGLIGWSRGTCGSSFWDTETSGMSSSDGGTGLSTLEMVFD